MKGVYLFLADGFEEIEALATVDVLRRGAVEVRTVSITGMQVVNGAHGVPVTADLTWPEFKSGAVSGGTDAGDAMIFPGGMPGTKNLAENQELMEMMRTHYAEGGTLAAICAAPGLVIPQLPTLRGKQFTCYDGFEAAPIEKGGEYLKAAAVTSGDLITGRGPGCAVEFALAIVRHLKGSAVADEISKGMLFNSPA